MKQIILTLVLAFALQVSPHQTFAQGGRFAWLSDTHIGSGTAEQDLLAAIRDINGREDIQFVILSGDITEFGSTTQLRAARGLLDSLRKPYYLIPGNHDMKWSESGTTMFRKIFGDEHFVFEWQGIFFIGLHEGPRMRMGDGFFAPEDLRWLDSTLAHIRDRHQKIVMVTHYPVDSSIANWYELLNRIKPFNVQAILVGHGHANRAGAFEGIPGVMSRSSLRGKEAAGGYTTTDIRNDTMMFSEHRTGSAGDILWHTVALGSRDYVSDTLRYPRPTFVINLQYPEVHSLWEFSSGYTIGSTPALVGDVVVVGDASGAVYGLELTDGSIRWKFFTGGPVYSSPAGSSGAVVFASSDGSIYCLRAASGELRWSFPTGAPVVAAPAIHQGRVFIGSDDGKFRCIDVATGSLVWQYGGLDGFVECKPLLYEGEVIFGAWDSHLYALDESSGRLLWKWEGERPGVLLSPAACWPVGSDGKVFVVAPDRMMSAIDSKSGLQRWRSAKHQVRESIGISEDGARVYVRSMNDSLIALSAAGDELSDLWVTNAGFGYDINSAMIVEKEGVVFYGTKDGLLLAMDAKTGSILWEHRMGVAPLNTILPVGANEVIVSDWGGTVRAIRSGGRDEKSNR